MVSSEFLDTNESSLSIGLVTPPPEVLLTPNIGVIGVGGAGGNAVNNMVTSELNGVSFFVANTDAQALSRSLVSERIQLGVALTQGLGAGANPEVGRAAAEETAEKLADCLKGLHLLFITAGMGGGTGTGAAPVIARLAKEMGILTVGVVSKPFQFEGSKRMRTANNGIAELKKHVDTLLVIPNQNLFRIVSNSTTFADAFKTADGVLCQGVRSITDLIIKPGMINLDFADVKTVLSSMGRAMMGTGEATGENRAEIAVEKAISNPLLDDSSIRGAKSVLLNISGGLDLTLAEVDLAAERIREELGEEDANIIFGTCADEALHGMIRISIVATGIDETANETTPVESFAAQQPKETVVEVPQTDEKSSTCEKENKTEEQLALIEKNTSSEEAHFESVVRQDEDDATLDQIDIVVETIEKPRQQPLLFQEETPKIKPSIQIRSVPEVQPAIDLDSKKQDINVKPIRGGLFDFMPGFGRKKDKMDVAAEAGSISTPRVSPASGQNYDDPFESVDLPAFLRR
ncbi:MAG: cell division protein FtsZ [Alphaproteobacteria bacterium]|nr:cell division protein FtsZ [Alphaproteobacteria bacterium]